MNLKKVVNLMIYGTTLAFIMWSVFTMSFVSSAIAEPPVGPPESFPIIPDGPETKDNGNIHQKFKQYIKDKYKDISEYSWSDVKTTKHGLSGMMSLSGKIRPHKKPSIDMTAETDRHTRAKAIAKSFMEDEAALLGIVNPDEIHEVNILTGKEGYTIVDYKKYINDIELESAYLQITIDLQEYISGVTANIIPVSPEMYEATKKEHLTQDEIKSVLEADFTENDWRRIRNINANDMFTSFKKKAITSPPYVIWDVFYMYYYTIDAFTGKILTKIDTRIPPPPAKPKDNSDLIMPSLPDNIAPQPPIEQNKSNNNIKMPPLPLPVGK